MYHKVDERRVLTLIFDPVVNRFRDLNGDVIHDIFSFVTPGQVMIFREYKNIYIVRDVTRSFWVEMIYPDYLEY